MKEADTRREEDARQVEAARAEATGQEEMWETFNEGGARVTPHR